MKTTIGGFDGMHKAHMELIKRSDNYIVIEKNSTLTPFFDRIEYSSKLLNIFQLNEIKHLKKNEFIEILKSLEIKEITVGYDFRFGKNRSGSIDDLKKAFKVNVINEIKINGIGVHSHLIRTLISNNEIKKANKFLGHTYKIKGIQIKGQGIGSKELLPTININLLHNYTLPKGVFITKTNNIPSITFIGTRSTDNSFSIETHLLIYKKFNGLIKIEFLEFLRNNKKFDDLNELKKQIIYDKKTAEEYFKKSKS